MDKNTSHLAGEFLVAGELARRGLSVSITFGNAKSVDIFAETASGKYCIDAKALRGKSNWPISRPQIRDDVIYVFVYLGTESAVAANEAPEYYVVPATALLEDDLISDWGGNRSGVTYQALSTGNYRDAWDVFK